MSKVNLPKIDISGENASIEDLIDNLLMMRKELEYTLLNLNSENIPSLSGINDGLNKVVKDTNGNSSSIIQNANQIALNVSDINGNSSSIVQNATSISSNVTAISTNAGNISTNSSNITQNANSISLNVTSINNNSDGISSNSASININADSITSNVTAISNNAGNISSNSSSISQNASNINLRVQKNDIINQINISTESIDIDAGKINLNGVTTMTGLANINGILHLGTNSTYNQIEFGANSTAKIKVDGNAFVFYGGTVTLPGDLILNGKLLMSGEDIDCDDIQCDDIYADDINCDTVNGKLPTGPYYSANFCYIDAGSSSIVIRNSSGSELGTISFD